MRLFENELRDARDPAYRVESTFDYLDRSSRPPMVALREVLEDWWSRYPAAHQLHLHSRLSGPTESIQRSAFWELDLHESFLRAGYQVDVSAATPDFTIDGPGGRFHVEATARFESPAVEAQQRREAVLHDLLDRTRSNRPSAWRLFGPIRVSRPRVASDPMSSGGWTP